MRQNRARASQSSHDGHGEMGPRRARRYGHEGHEAFSPFPFAIVVSFVAADYFVSFVAEPFRALRGSSSGLVGGVAGSAS